MAWRAAVMALALGLAGCASESSVPVSTATPAPSPSPTALKWVEFGPGPLEFTAFANIITGRLSSLIALDENTFVVASEGGGLWRTTRATSPQLSWTVTSDGLPNLNFGALAQDPSHPEVLYAGSGSNNSDPRAQHGLFTASYGGGIFKSSDGGQTWSFLPGSALLKGMAISRIWVDPRDSEHQLVAVALSSITNLPPPGLLESRDGGRSFIPVPGFGPGQVMDLVSESGVLLAAKSTFVTPFAATVVRSEDAGRTWTSVEGLPPASSCYRFGIAAAKTEPGRFYTLAQAADRSSFVGLFTSSDSGRTWTEIPVPRLNALLGPANPISIIVDPADASTVYLGSVNLVRVKVGGGATLLTGGTEESPSLEESPHVDHRGLALSPSGALLDITDGGLWRLRNPATAPAFPATDWDNLNGTGGSLRTIEFTGIALHPTRADVILGGTQDNGSPRFEGLFTWDEHLETPDDPLGFVLGDGGKPVIEEGNPHIIWVQLQEGELYRSVNGGDTYLKTVNGLNLQEPSVFYAPIAQVLEAGNTTLAVGRTSVWESSADAATEVVWRRTSQAPLQPDALVSALAYFPGKRATLYAGTTLGGVFARTVEGGSFETRSAGLPANTVTALVVDPADPSRVYCSLAGTGAPHVFATRDGGEHWTDISGNLADLPILDLALEASDGQRTLFAGTMQGVYASSDEGRTWAPFGSGLPAVPVRSLALSRTRHTLAAGTYGRGLWQIPTRPGVTLPPPPIAVVRARNSPFRAWPARLAGLASVPLARRIQRFLDPQANAKKSLTPGGTSRPAGTSRPSTSSRRMAVARPFQRPTTSQPVMSWGTKSPLPRPRRVSRSGFPCWSEASTADHSVGSKPGFQLTSWPPIWPCSTP